MATIVFGILALIWPDITVLVIAVVFAARPLIFGVTQVLAAFRGRGPERSVAEPAAPGRFAALRPRRRRPPHAPGDTRSRGRQLAPAGRGVVTPRYTPDVEVLGVAALAPASDLLRLVAHLPNVTGGNILTTQTVTAYAVVYPDVSPTTTWCRAAG